MGGEAESPQSGTAGEGGAVSSDGGAAGVSTPGSGGTGDSGGGGDEAGGAGATAGNAGEAGSGNIPVDCITSADAPLVSGTRLKVKCVRGADGSQTYRRGVLFDSELGVDCAYRAAADGSWRCLPVVLPVPVEVYFTDDECTQATAWFIGDCQLEPPPQYAHTFGLNPPCGATNNDIPIKVYAVVSEINEPAMIYAQTQSGCEPASKPSGRVVYSLGPELPVTTFVEGSKEVSP